MTDSIQNMAPAGRTQDLTAERFGIVWTATPAGFKENGCDVYDLMREGNFVNSFLVSPMGEVFDAFEIAVNYENN